MTSEVEADEGPAEVRYPLPQFAESGRRGKRALIAINVLVIALGIWQLTRGHIPLSAMAVPLMSAFTWWRVHSRGRDAVATPEGISGPHLRKPILWGDVECLIEATRYDPEIYVVLSGGTRKGTGFPPSYFDQISAVAPVRVEPFSPFG